MSQASIYDLIYFGDCKQIKLEGEPELYVGDDLFNLINGGAELYHELGFVEVLAIKVAVNQQVTSKVEVYDMGSSEAAWGIFSLTSTSDAQYLKLGDTARSGQGFMQAIKDRYMIYVYNDNMDKEWPGKIISCIGENIETYSQAPEILLKVNTLKAEDSKSIYFKGNLGLSSIYNFHYKDIFDYDEGAAIVGDKLISVAMKYSDKEKCHDKFMSSFVFFNERNKYHDQNMDGSAYYLKDRKERHLDFHWTGSYIIVFIYEEDLDPGTEKEKFIGLFNY